LLRKDRIIGDKVRGEEFYYIYETLLNVSVREDFISDNFLECIWCEIKIEGEVTIILLDCAIDARPAVSQMMKLCLS